MIRKLLDLLNPWLMSEEKRTPRYSAYTELLGENNRLREENEMLKERVKELEGKKTRKRSIHRRPRKM